MEKKSWGPIKGITRRWVGGNLMVMLLFLILAEIVLMIYTVNNSYSVARQALLNRIAIIDTQLATSSASTPTARAEKLRGLLEKAESDTTLNYSMQLLDEHGRLFASSQAFEKAFTSVPDDYRNALLSETGVGEAISVTASGERVMAVTYLVPDPAGGITALRLLTSMAGIDSRVWQVLAVSLALLGATFVLILLTGVYFIRSIVRPLAQVEATATKISKGNFDIRMENKYPDEIGRLCDTINHMAEELSKTERLKNDFISSVSHELRTPLTSIKGWTETLARIDDVKDENYRHGMRIIGSETDRLYNMVEELLDFSRMQNRGLSLTQTHLDMGAEVGDAILMFQQRAVQDSIRLVYEEPEDVLTVSGDSSRLRQVFVNILDNAFKYSPKGSAVTVKLLAQAGQCLLSVADEGQGIEEDELELVKTRFYKGRGSVRGSGIGLAVVNEIVRAHGGELNLASTVGRGTTVTVSLPLLNEEDPDEENGGESAE